MQSNGIVHITHRSAWPAVRNQCSWRFRIHASDPLWIWDNSVPRHFCTCVVYSAHSLWD